MKCRICGNDIKEIYDTKFDNHYMSCDNCDFIGIYPDDQITFEQERDEYDRHENCIENEGYVAYFKKFLDSALIPYVSEGSGLDFGSGPEPVLTQVIHRDYPGYEMDHYDLHYQPVKVFEGKSYDYILSTEVAEHLLDPLDVVGLLADHLKPGGILAMMTLFHHKDEEHFLQWWYRRDITHIGFFTPKTFEVMAELTGMEVIYTDGNRYITLRKK